MVIIAITATVTITSYLAKAKALKLFQYFQYIQSKKRTIRYYTQFQRRVSFEMALNLKGIESTG